MGLTGKTGDSPTGDNSSKTLTLGNSDNINVFVLGKDGVNSDFLLKESLCESNLGSSISTSVNLDLHDVSLLDAKVELLDLTVCNHTNNSAELADAVKFMLNILSTISSVLLGVLGESLLLTLVPVLVTTTLELLGKMLCENGSKSPQSTRGLDVSYNTNDDHGRGLEDGDSVNDLALVHEGTGTVDSTDNVGHSSLVSAEGGEVGRSRGVEVLGEGTTTTMMTLGTLPGVESKGSVTGGFELTVGHDGGWDVLF
jgi:hypothetical protein